MFQELRQDIDHILKMDPAARSRTEVLLCYPCVRALFWYRVAHRLIQRGHPLLARWLSQRARRKTGIEIHPGAVIGKCLFIDHGMGVVIGETAILGDYVTLYQGVTLGGTGKETGKRHPTLGNYVTVGAGAKVLGPFTVGDGAKVGAGSIVLKEVPPYATVVGNPGHVVRLRGEQVPKEPDLDQVNLPDPVQGRLIRMSTRMDVINVCLTHEEDCDTCQVATSPYCPKRYRKEDQDEDL